MWDRSEHLRAICRDRRRWAWPVSSSGTLAYPEDDLSMGENSIDDLGVWLELKCPIIAKWLFMSVPRTTSITNCVDGISCRSLRGAYERIHHPGNNPSKLSQIKSFVDGLKRTAPSGPRPEYIVKRIYLPDPAELLAGKPREKVELRSGEDCEGCSEVVVLHRGLLRSARDVQVGHDLMFKLQER